jgi:AcrR family transcriptional regulator
MPSQRQAAAGDAGTGPLWFNPPGGEQNRRRALTRDRVIAEALAIISADGAAALSMRALAARLGVVPAALYRHVTSKDQLYDLVLDGVLAEVDCQADPALPWTRQVSALARRLRAGGVDAGHARGTARPGWTSGKEPTRSSRRWQPSRSRTPRPVSRLTLPTGSSPQSRWTGSNQMNRSTGLIRSTRCSRWSLRTRVSAMSRRRSASQHSGRQETSRASRAECRHVRHGSVHLACADSSRLGVWVASFRSLAGRWSKISWWWCRLVAEGQLGFAGSLPT